LALAEEVVMTQKLTLISHKLCPYVQRAVIALTEKGVPKISPLGKVPVLLVETTDGEAALFESNVICEYIEETQAGAKLHPRDALQRAQHRAWMEFGSTILSELWGLETTGDSAVFESASRRRWARVHILREIISAWWMRCSRRSSAISTCSIS
jgi:glutathione S-transferase